MCEEIKQCKALTKRKCQCKNHVTNGGEFCERHSTVCVVTLQPARVTQISQPAHPNWIKKQNSPFTPQNWTGVKTSGKTPDEMYNYLFPK